jgi:hydrogenase maturation factor HypF (carbamoyltransferase family)
MLLPTSVDLLRCVERTLETVIVPKLNGLGERSAAATMGHMLRYVALRIEKEGQILADEIEVLRPLLSQVDAHLASLPRSDSDGSQIRDAIAALLGVRTEVTYEGQAAVELDPEVIRLAGQYFGVKPEANFDIAGALARMPSNSLASVCAKAAP